MDLYNLSLSDKGRNSKLKDLCEFYKHKLERFQEKYSLLHAVIEKVGSHQKENDLMHLKLAAVTEELYKTQKAVSDLQIYLFREREENLRLSAGNDDLKILNFEVNHKLDNLLKSKHTPRLVGSRRIGADCDSGRTTIIEGKEESTRTTSRSKETMELEIQALRTQIENLQIFHKNEVDVLLRDREVVAEERSVEVARLHKHISYLTASLSNARAHLQDAVKGFVVEHEKYERDLESWMEHRNLMEKQILLNECDNGNVSNSSPRLSSRSTKILQERLESQEALTNTYRQQCKQLQMELNKWRHQAESSETSYREKIQQLTGELTLMKNRYEVLDRRRLSEAEGFRSDIKFMRERIKEIANTIKKLKDDEAIAKMSAKLK